jgi:hypothetical protein
MSTTLVDRAVEVRRASALFLTTQSMFDDHGISVARL